MGNTQELETKHIGDLIRDKLKAMSNADGLKRTQRWLSGQTSMGEVELSNKINSGKFTQMDLDKINEILSTDFKVELATE